MNIAIDLQPLVSPTSKNRGIGNYNIDQLKLLVEKDKENNYVFFNAYNDESIFDILKINEDLYSNVKDIHIYTGKGNYLIQSETHGRIKKYENIFGEIVKNFLKENKIDVFYFTSPFDYWDIFNIEWFESVSTVATVYDIIPYLFPKRYLADKDMKKWYMRIIDFIKKVDRIEAISQSVKNDLIKYLNISEDKIDVIYAGIDKRYVKLDNIEDEEDIRKKYGLNDEFIMCTGGADPRKNMNELIIAYSKLPQNLKDRYMLAIVCSLHKEGEIELKSTAVKYGVEDRVVMTNFVPFDHLLKLYNMTALMAFPSQYEGFGLPVIEAMACGAKVLTSNNSSLGEIAEGAAILVDPFDINSIKEGLEEALNKLPLSEFEEEMKKKVNLYTWENTVKLTMESLAKIQIKDNFNINKGLRKKIAMFTPLPPLKSGISDYSYDIILALIKYFDIDVYIDDGYKCDVFKDNEKVHIYNHKEYEKNRNLYFDTIFQVGNSEFHIYMFEYIKKYKGTVELHDYNLHGVIHYCTAGSKNFDEYENMLSEDDSQLVKQYIEDLKLQRSGLKIHEIQANGIVTNYANKIIVHSDYAKKKLLEKDIKRNVCKINLYAEIENLPDRVKLRGKYGFKSDELIIASFGFVSETKRIDKALEAIRDIAKEKENVRYILVGEANNEMKNRIDIFCKKNKIEGKVSITGFIDIVQFKEYVELCDVCINLRYPYNGETSASLTRVLAAGKPVIVSDIGSFSEIPNKCCVKIPISQTSSDKREIDSLTNELRKMINDKEYIQDMSRNARKYAEEELDINIIATKYRDYILKDKSTVLNEQTLRNLITNEIGKVVNKDIEIYKLSKTLSSIYVTR